MLADARPAVVLTVEKLREQLPQNSRHRVYLLRRCEHPE